MKATEAARFPYPRQKRSPETVTGFVVRVLGGGYDVSKRKRFPWAMSFLGRRLYIPVMNSHKWHEMQACAQVLVDTATMLLLPTANPRRRPFRG